MKNWIRINIINRLFMLIVGTVMAAMILGALIIFLITATIAAPIFIIIMVSFFNDI